MIDTARQVVIDRNRLHNAAGVFHVALSTDGKLGVAAQLRPKNLVPLAHVEHGWVFGNSLSFSATMSAGRCRFPSMSWTAISRCLSAW